MDTETLARFQFALTIMFHYIYPPLSIGLGPIMVIMELLYLGTRNPLYREMSKFWTKIFALTFAMGVATGIVMSFEFGTNWSSYSRFVGDVFGSALAAEGIFAFFLESGFLAVLLFGWDRVKPFTHFFATLMVCLGAHFSAVWITIANSWMQTPAGFKVVGEGLSSRAVIIDFWGMVFNPSSMVRLAHTLIGCWLAGAFLVISVSAFYLLKKRHQQFAKASLKIGLGVACVSLVLQLVAGDQSAKIVAQHQPAKLAAMEGVYETQKRAPIYLFGLPSSEEQKVQFGLGIPGMLSFLTYSDFNAEIKGLDQIPRADWPRVPLVFQSYHLMVQCWGLMVLVSLLALWVWWRGRLDNSKWVLRACVASVFLPQIANQAGWMTAEVGRYPWIVYNLLRIPDGLSKVVTSQQILGSIIMFGIVYTFLFILFIYLLDQKVRHGPTDIADVPAYHLPKKLLEELEHGSDS
jgi:cytochrome d ubiquinol oxidase subunit I